ncbi:MAG: hypothetical protein JF597_48475 [Streptomyces sp.]|uniref:hypothetical protein n=1 Tax=Streptomyces sp. TaxID=1931 RepID=UPI0025E5B569|nr:hypothetical protein [Streptomyces sp.]MBW8801112.1 hypothetical protein [Streptomyces sp.]
MTDRTQLNTTIFTPMQFRFEDEADIAKYGADWFLYDEWAIVRLPVSRLLELEQATGYPVRTAFKELRQQSVLGDLLATWTAVHLADAKLAGEFADWAPLVFAIEWRGAKLDDLGKDDKPSPEPPPTTPTVALPSLPVAG